MIYFIVIPIIIVLDQLSKLAIQKNLVLGETIPVLENIFHLTYIKNYGAAFSFFQDQKFILIFLPVLMVIVILCYMIYVRKRAHPMFMISLAMIVSGGIGNLIDRLYYGYVVDFFDFRVFPVFNVADISVCCGCGLLIIFMIFIEPKLCKEEMIFKDEQ